MALAIDSSSPVVATQTSGTTATVVTASFTPPAGALLLIGWAGNTGTASDPGAPAITDSLGGHLTYTQIGWKHRSVSPTVDGQAAMWWAVVGSSAAMTVTVTTGTGSGARQGALKVWVITGADTTTPIGASGATGSTSAAAIAQNYTASATSGWGFLTVCDWDLKGAETAGTGCTVDGSANILSDITYAFARRTTADDSSGVTNTLRTTLPGSSTNLAWVYAEVLPAAGGSTPISVSESGSAADAAAVTAAAPLSDAASTADAVAVGAASALPEAGAATESLTAAAAVPLTESAAAADGLLAGIGIALPDAGAATESLVVVPVVPLADGGSSTQTLTANATAGLTDNASATDTLAVQTAIPLADMAAAAQVLTASAAFALADAAAAVDAAAVAAAVPLVQAGSASDGIAIDTGGSGTSKSLADLGDAADALCVCITQLRPNVGTTAKPEGLTVRPFTGVTGSCC